MTPFSAPSTYRVNIIFVRDSVAELVPFFRSLLEHTDCRYRLVANGCTANERAILIAHAKSAGSRVEFHDGHPGHSERSERSERSDVAHSERESDRVVTHGAMLERLLAVESEEYFVFVDSDVLAIGPASFDGLIPDETEAARCSALPLWHRPSERIAPRGFRILGGRFVGVEGSDVTLGCSYAAGYRTDRLRSIVDRWQIGLAHAHAADLPAPVRDELARRNLEFDLYDTLKVANILLHGAGWPVTMVDLDNIVHVGALSGAHDPVARRLPMRTAKALLGSMGPRLRIFQWRAQGLSWAEARSMADLAVRRKSAGDFAERLASGCSTIRTAPGWCRDPRVYEALAALHHRHGPDGHGTEVAEVAEEHPRS